MSRMGMASHMFAQIYAGGYGNPGSGVPPREPAKPSEPTTKPVPRRQWLSWFFWSHT